MASYNITVNTFPKNSFNLASWNLTNEEPERICVRKGDKEFCLVFDEEFRLEIWNLDENGEIFELQSSLSPLGVEYPNIFK